MIQTELNMFVILLSSIVAVSVCEHLILGDVSGKQMVYHSSEQHTFSPFVKKVKNVFYNSPDQKTIIGGIIAYDNSHSGATAKVTAGGVGFTYVNIRMKSERGQGLDFDIGIYSTENKIST